MIGKLIERPIAVTMAIVALVVLGVVSIGLLPISLMPNVDIPQITIQFSYKGASAREVNDVVIKQMRQQLIQLSDLEELTCTANNGGGIIFMQFDYGSDTDLNFIEVNEKIDRLLPSLPKDMERPRIIKASATDIPVFFIDLTIDEQSDEAFIELSKFAREVIVKRIEQIPQVAMVDPAAGSVMAIAEALTNIVFAPLTDKLASVSLIVRVKLSAKFRFNCSKLVAGSAICRCNVRFGSISSAAIRFFKLVNPS